jgi:serine/threonine protein phosphatase PrpC
LAYENPVILFELAVNSGVSKVHDCLQRMIDRVPDVMGKYDQEKEYRAEIAVDCVCSISRVWTNRFFRPAGMGTSPMPDAGDEGAPVLKLFGARAESPGNWAGISISGRWKAFDGELSLMFVLKDRIEPYFDVFKKQYYIAGDPKSLWKEMEVVDFEGYEAGHTDCAAREVQGGGGLIAVAASRRGRSHANVGKPRDDSFRMTCDHPSGWTAVAVADGAGSSRYSREGSRLACETSVNAFLGHADSWRSEGKDAKVEGVIRELKGLSGGEASLPASDARFASETGMAIAGFVINSVRSAYIAIADETKRKEGERQAKAAARERPYGGQDDAKAAGESGRPVTLRDYHTTLLFAAFKRFDFGYFIASFWIGDGGLSLYGPNGTGDVKILGLPDAGEHAGETRFLTMGDELAPDRAISRVFYSFPDDFEALILASDGITDPFFPSEDSILSPDTWRTFWTGILREGSDGNPGCPELFDDGAPPELKSAKLLDWLNFWKQGEHDDRTILIVKRHPESGQASRSIPAGAVSGQEATPPDSGHRLTESALPAPGAAPADPGRPAPVSQLTETAPRDPDGKPEG